MSETIVIERPSHEIAILRLNRPEKLNAMDAKMLELLFEKLDILDRDDACRAIIVTGAGRGFCAGLDLSALTDASPPTAALGAPQRLMIAMRRSWTRLLPRIRALRPAVIAAVNGPAVGGGFVLALAADIRIASVESSFQDAFAKVGVSGCELGLGWLLPRLVGSGRALEIALTGRRIGAEEAERYGLVHEVWSNEALIEKAIAKANEIALNPPFSVWMTRDTMWSSLEIPSLQAAIDLENRTQTLCLLTEDGREQLRARRDKRKPSYRNH
jgi:enoyl-CoA hydratase